MECFCLAVHVISHVHCNLHSRAALACTVFGATEFLVALQHKWYLSYNVIAGLLSRRWIWLNPAEAVALLLRFGFCTVRVTVVQLDVL